MFMTSPGYGSPPPRLQPLERDDSLGQLRTLDPERRQRARQAVAAPPPLAPPPPPVAHACLLYWLGVRPSNAACPSSRARPASPRPRRARRPFHACPSGAPPSSARCSTSARTAGTGGRPRGRRCWLSWALGLSSRPAPAAARPCARTT